MRPTTHLLPVMLLVLTACNGTEQLGQQRSAILGGSTSHRSAVGLLVHDSSNPEEDRACTATLIAPRFVLTAAHCVTARTSPPYDLLDPLYLFIGPDAALDPSTGFLSGKEYRVRDATIRTGYAGGGTADLAVVELESEVPSWVAEPLRLASQAPAVGDSVTLVGFGISALGDTSTAGKQREAEALVTHRTSTTFQTEGKACHGDSGGPALVSGEIVGVHSGVTDEACSVAIDMRVDVYRGWITGITDGAGETEPEETDESEPLPSDGGEYGDACEGSHDCESHVCVTVSSWFSSYSACSTYCDPAEPDACPNGDKCDGDAFVCVPDRGGKADQVHIERVQTDEAAAGCSMASGASTTGPGALLLLLLGVALLRRRG